MIHADFIDIIKKNVKGKIDGLAKSRKIATFAIWRSMISGGYKDDFRRF